MNVARRLAALEAHPRFQPQPSALPQEAVLDLARLTTDQRLRLDHLLAKAPPGRTRDGLHVYTDAELEELADLMLIVRIDR